RVAELEAIEVRHRHVAEHEIRLDALDQGEPFDAVGGHVDLVATAPHRRGHELLDHRIVLAEHDLRHPVSPYTPTATRGSVNWKTDPSPGVLSTQAFPPCISMIWREIGSPRPVPWM